MSELFFAIKTTERIAFFFFNHKMREVRFQWKCAISHWSSWNCQMPISPSSLQDASSPASFGFQLTQLTS